jgi:hypothetical protein
MNNLTYSIYSGQQQVSESLEHPITDLGNAKRVAADLSQRQPGEAISVVSRQLGGTGARSTVARYLNGEEIPVLWRVDFFGYLHPSDDLALSKASVAIRDKRSEVGPDGSMRTGYARNVVSVEADDGDAALAQVKAALGPKAAECSEWHVGPA